MRFESEDRDAKKFSNIIGIDNEKILISKYDIVNNFQNLIQINEGPIGGIANIAMLLLCKKVKQDGLIFYWLDMVWMRLYMVIIVLIFQKIS